MIAAQFTTNEVPSGVITPFTRASRRPFVHFQSNTSPLLHQWHQLINVIREKANRRQWVTLVNPPFIPNDHYLNEIGLGDHYVRVIRLEQNCEEKLKYIQQCVQNGKSSVVAIWSDDISELPNILLNDSPLSCQALVFSNYRDESKNRGPQLEMAI